MKKFSKRMVKQLFVASVALSALTACSDALVSEVDNSVMPEAGAPGFNTAVLTDASGQVVSDLSSNFNTYYLDIKTDDMWYIVTDDNMEFTPSKMCGKGNARVPVLIGNNWAQDRQLNYTVKFVGESPRLNRAPGDSVETTIVTDKGEVKGTVSQQSSMNLARFKEMVNSNLFVGYGYNPSKHAVPELCTGIEIFKMDSLVETKNIKSSLAAISEEHYFTGESDSAIDKTIMAKGHIGGNFGSVKFSPDSTGADVTVGRQRHAKQIVMQKSLTRSLYSREIDFANLIFNKSNFSEGFKYYKNRLIRQINQDTTDFQKQMHAEDFFKVVGTHFVAKAMLGCELDYRITIDSSTTNNYTNVKAALDFKWQQQVKDTTDVDSVTLNKLKQQNANLKNFVFKGNVQVKDSTFVTASSTKADVKVRGGDAEKVNILTTGGTLHCEDMAEWMMATEPDKAMMVGVMAHPIYSLFDDSVQEEYKAYWFLRTYIDKYYNITGSSYGAHTDLGKK